MQEYGAETGIHTLQKREQIAVFAMYTTMAVSALTAVGETLELSGVIDLAYGIDDPLVAVYSIILLANTVIFFGSAIAVAMWIHRAHANLREAGVEGLKFTPGWAVGWYFIPIAFLFKPFQAMRELWTESHQTHDSFSAPAPGPLALWWGFWIGGNLIANVSMRLSLMGGSSSLEIATLLGLCASIATIVAAWLLMQIIMAITEAQTHGIAAQAIFE